MVNASLTSYFSLCINKSLGPYLMRIARSFRIQSLLQTGSTECHEKSMWVRVRACTHPQHAVPVPEHVPGGNGVLGRSTHTLTGTGVVQGLENVFSLILRISYLFLSERLQAALLSTCFSPQRVYRHRALCCHPSYSPRHVHLMRGYSWCACTVRQSSFRSLFPPAQTRAESLPTGEPGCGQDECKLSKVQTRLARDHRGRWKEITRGCWHTPHINGDICPLWLSKSFLGDLSEISAALSHRTAAVTEVVALLSDATPERCVPWVSLSCCPSVAPPALSQGLGAERTAAACSGELQYLARVLGKQAVLASVKFTIIPPLFASSSAESVWVLGGAIV